MDLKHYNNHDDDGDVYVGDDGDLGDDEGDDAKNGATCINIKGKQSGVLSCYVLKVVLNLAHGVVSCVCFHCFLDKYYRKSKVVGIGNGISLL